MKYFFFDLDGSLMYNSTLKSNEVFIPKENVKMLKVLHENENVEYGIASGRIASVSKKLFDQEKLNGWIIGENGGTILNKDSQYVYKNRISEQTYSELISFALDKGYHFEAYTDEDLFVNNVNNPSIFLDRIINNYKGILNINNISSFEEISPYLSSINHFSFVPFIDQSNLEDIKDFLNKYNDKLDWINSSIDIVDTIPKNIDKIIAFKEFMKINNIDKNDIHYLGDGFNDLESFKYLDNVYVMDHAHDDLKKHAKYIVTSASEAIDIFLKNIK